MIHKKIHRFLELKTSLLVSSIFAGDYATRIRGKGLEFEWYDAYNMGDDAGNIDFIKSEISGILQKKVYTEERQLDVYILSDMKRKNDVYIWWVSKEQLFLQIMSLIWYSTIQWWNRFGFSDLDQWIFFPATSHKNEFENMLQRLSRPQSRKKTPVALNNKLIFYITSSHTHTKHIQALSHTNDVIVIHLFHAFENTLNGTGVIHLTQDGKTRLIDLDDTVKKQAYTRLRKQHIASFRSQVLKTGARYAYIDTQSDIHIQLSQIFDHTKYA